MAPPVWLNEVQSGAVAMLIVAGLGLILPDVVDRRNSWHRAVLMGIGILLALRYVWWRATQTLAPPGLTWDFAASGSLFVLEALTLVSAISASVLMSRVRERGAEADTHARWWASGPPPRVAVLIATYNEDRDVLERSIVGVLALDYPNAEVLVLDDGRRAWLRDYCAQRGARHVTRPDNAGAKAGNINHALTLLAREGAPPDFFAVLDADFVPHRKFLDRTLALFHDPQVGLVQTPQHFFNADPIQHNLGLSRSYPDEQRFFFDHMQPARDAWGMAICCGTSSVARWSAVADLGGLPTDSVTEDFLLTLALQERGWRTVYLNEPLTEGLAPEGLKEYITQRSRWCLGLMQIARGRLGPLARHGLRLRDRWSVLDSALYWLTAFPFRIAGLVYPLLYWYFNVVVVDAEVADVLSYFGVYFVWTMLAHNLLSPGMLVPAIRDVSQHLGAWQISRAAIGGLLRPRGHPFSVTAKGGDRGRRQVQWRLMAPFAGLWLLTLGGLLLGVGFDSFDFRDAGDGKAVILFWTFYNLLVLSLTILACIELPREESHVADAPARAVFRTGTAAHRVWIAALTRDTARLRGATLPVGTRGVLVIPDVGEIDATLIEARADGGRVHLFPDEAANRALLRRFYTEGDAPGVLTAQVREMVGDLIQRVSRGR